jgi:hypothetical protein
MFLGSDASASLNQNLLKKVGSTLTSTTPIAVTTRHLGSDGTQLPGFLGCLHCRVGRDFSDGSGSALSKLNFWIRRTSSPSTTLVTDGLDWQLQIDEARTRFARLYPQIEAG